jgi:NADH-quinone oxidoreductase subunit B
VVKGTEALGIPVDVLIPGCPPRPENLLFGIMKLQGKDKERKTCQTVRLSD